ncbi:aromatic acid exporter family protein [Clostridium cochlearium]|uniref:aromatic acid exporter family protein n=1 Tax=Clostridium cochlearium TaxID=1494 RepID=UPI001459A61D|nr:aromatic acid exporter family protein [Clostridium cochlearium]MCG4571691.1 aromatic acid exporter family protein [Clostridium cochlearium]NME94700.1 aromatic acid exporter family protein [Clostridium cochlearium]
MMNIGYRTLKTAIGSALAIIIAKWFGLQYATAAGIITILSVGKTRKKSIKIMLKRIISTLLALLISLVLFNIFGFKEIVFGAFLLIFIPLAVKFNVEEGIVVSSVLVTHLLTEKSTSLFWIINEIALMLVGVIVALIVNLYMPNTEDKIKEYQMYIEEHMKEILLKMSFTMKDGKKCFVNNVLLEELENVLDKGRKLTYINLNNNIVQEDKYYVRYMNMRKNQVESIKYMLNHFKEDFSRYEQALIMANFIEKVANSIYENNTAENLLEDLDKLREDFRKMELPKTREEFEIRASLFQFLNDMEQFLRIKNDFKKTEIN